VADYFEIDYLDVEAKKSGDAITIRYELNGIVYIQVVDGGFQDTGEIVVKHIKKYYGDPKRIDHVVATHPDGDHAAGLRTVLEAFEIGSLWMLRPWIYAPYLIDQFTNYTLVENLTRRLRDIYPNLAVLEEIASRRRIPIREPFQGAQIGAFTVLAPTRARYLELILASEKTPESQSAQLAGSAVAMLEKALAKVVRYAKAAWGFEVFSAEDTSAENEMSVVQYGLLCGKRILLTADAGRAALTEAADFAPRIGIVLPGIDRFQVPHHGSRRNVSTEVLDRWLGRRLSGKSNAATFQAICSAAKADEDHPRRSVKRAIIHRGGDFFDTKHGQSIWSYENAPQRPDYRSLTPSTYPEDQETE
jgi:beta-lactamase superfamily II metal-dependent hydrolase